MFPSETEPTVSNILKTSSRTQMIPPQGKIGSTVTVIVTLLLLPEVIVSSNVMKRYKGTSYLSIYIVKSYIILLVVFNEPPMFQMTRTSSDQYKGEAAGKNTKKKDLRERWKEN